MYVCMYVCMYVIYVYMYECTVCMYCDMTPEHWKCAVRKAPHRRPLLDNGSLGTFPEQWIGLWKPGPCCEINTLFRVNGQAANVLLGYRKLI
jgi:hypothetical protein